MVSQEDLSGCAAAEEIVRKLFASIEEGRYRYSKTALVARVNACTFRQESVNVCPSDVRCFSADFEGVPLQNLRFRSAAVSL
jgi:succinate dehydrogenase/fumarate reductase-like Fe-S protein